MADNAALSITGDISIEAWIKLEQLPSTAGGAFEVVTKLNTTGNQRSYRLLINNADDKLLFQFSAAGAGFGTQFSMPAFTSADVGKWVHVAVAVDVSTPSASMYKNGVSQTVTDVSTTDTSIYDSTAQFQIGNFDGGSTYFDGLISNVRIFSDLRTEAEIQDNMFSILTGTSNNLVGSWYNDANDHNDDAGSNNLTASGSPVFSTNVPWTGANTTDWSSLEIKSDPTKVSGSSNLTNFPALISDSNLTSAVYAGLNGSQYSLGLTSSAAVSMAEHADFDATSAFTVGAWIKTTNNAFMVIAQNYDRNTTPIRTGWYLAKVAGGAIRILTSDNIDDGNNNHEGTNTDSQDGNWHFIVATYDGSNLATFVDGVADGSTASASPPAYGTTYPRIGCLRDGGAGGTNSLFWDGKIDGFFFINGTAWTEAQVQQYMGLDLADQSVSNLVTYQRFDNNLNDSSGSTNTHNGSAIGTPTYSSTDIAKQLQAPDLRITTDAEGTTEIPFEIVALDKVSETAEIWAKVPTLSYNSNTSLYIWYGNSSAVAYDANAPFGSQAVWSGYVLVSHDLKSESTSYATTPTVSGASDTTGKIGSAKALNGSTNYISFPDGTELDMTGAFSIQAWVNRDVDSGGYERIISKSGTSSANYWYWLQLTNTDTYQFGIRDSSTTTRYFTTTATLSTATPQMVLGQYNGTTALDVYIDGSQASGYYTRQPSSEAVGTSNDNLEVGRLNSSGTWYYGYDGWVDELRLKKGSNLSSDWIATEYANQNSPSTFWTQTSGRRYYAPGIWR